MEIEKKFRIKKLPDNLKEYEKKHIEQGYLCVNPVVRIRKSDDKYILTYKSPIDKMQEENKDVRINNEVEVYLTKEGYEHLREKIDDNLIEKTRYIIPLEDGHTGELDIFGGALEGLYFIEVEFDSEEDAKNFVPPKWFGENISDDKRYANSYLSKCDDLSVFL